ncbi:Uncharacterised protein [Legionella lansingensis]|uniref:Uncharacterized protein n=1 Tax=Legionella lansingensis TaxID=45067 RepID=A0A0W0VZF0_9GAMM|nr:hypothetical protein Llan_0164 [Legionella lansingensis]SNV51408.1 Uncharacterised protein [Legionella lansingensis]
MTINEFLNRCKDTIKQSESELGKHLGWNMILEKMEEALVELTPQEEIIYSGHFMSL